MNNNHTYIIADIRSNNNNGKCTGHYLPVAQNYIDIIGDNGTTVVAGGPIYRTKFHKNLLELPYDVLVSDNQIVKKIKSLLNARYLFKKTKKEDIIVLQQSTATTSFVAIALFCPRNRKLFMIQYDLSGLRGMLNRLLYSFAKPKIRGLLCPADSIGNGYKIPYIVVPDYIYCGKIFSQKKTFKEKQFDLCIVGRLSYEKGVIESVKKIAHSRYKTIIAGSPESKAFEKDLLNAIDGAKNIELRLGYISEKEYDYYISDSRFALLNYHGTYVNRSSGVVFDFLFRNVPIFAYRCLAMNFIESNQCGICYDDLDQFDLDLYADEAHYTTFLKGIEKYKQSFITHKKNIIQFITK